MKSLLVFLTLFVVFTGCGTNVANDENSFTPASASNPFQSVVVTGRTVNLRQGPGTQYTIVGSASAGDSLMVTGEAPDWYKIYIPEDSLFAWIYSGLTSGADLPQ